MSKKMLVDASHPEETRVVVLDGTRVEEFDYESASRRQLKGNIYLAKVTRVEPSLQACFVEYGGNRHGFLAFSEIHPDYYQIPTADRQALLAANRAAQRHDDLDDEPAEETGEDDTRTDAAQPSSSSPSDITTSPSEPSLNGEAGGDVVEVVESGTDEVWVHDPDTDGESAPADESAAIEAHDQFSGDLSSERAFDDRLPEHESDDHDHSNDAEISPLEAAEAAEAAVSEASQDDAEEELPRRDYRSMRRYKIQEVIKRRQVLLVQVVKEERGNKGAALTTYLSLAGRYCVLMPNTDRGGGISRKISNVADRRKLKEAAGSLEVPEGMGVIIRTAGANRTGQEIKRDFEYLMRQWDAVRELTLRSAAPTLVYEEGNLIKRTIRDLYSKDIGDLLVQGDEGFRDAHAFMSMLMPSHADAVKHYRDPVPLFQRYGVEAALDGMFNPIVRLRSGGYIVINQTEALVAVDVNSGKSTREHHIEDTALKTNLEAAEEVARQLRLRDLAGLVVIDFIDMEEHRNNRTVEKRLKDCLRHDRARIQLGRISPFGLLEMSRQRLRAGMVEGATIPCPHCEGRGVIRSVGSMALRVLRAVEEYCQHEKLPAITLRLTPEIALYILNHKRAQLTAIEDRRGVYIYIEAKPSLAASAYEIERGAAVPFEPRKPVAASAVTVESELEANDDVFEDRSDEPSSIEMVESDDREDGEQPTAAGRSDGDGGRRRKRRRRRGGRDRDQGPSQDHQAGTGPQPEAALPQEMAGDQEADDTDDTEDGDTDGPAENGNGQHPAAAAGDNGEPRRKRRRGRRGRRGRRPGDGGAEPYSAQTASPLGHLPTPAEALDAPDWPATGGFDTQPGARPPVPRELERPHYETAVAHTAPPRRERVEAHAVAAEPPKSDDQKTDKPGAIASFFGFGGAKAEEDTTDESKPQRKGWWQRKADG